MEFIYYILLFFLWASIWSFSSVILHRLKNNITLSILSRSECPQCHHKLSMWNLVPIFSYLFQKWKCSYCNTDIPRRYLYLEIASWLLFLSLWTLINTYYNFWILVSLAIILTWWFILSVYDLFYKEVEDKVVIPFLVILVSILFYQDINNVNLISLYNLEQILQFNIISSLLSLLVICILYYTIFSEIHFVFLFIAIILSAINFLSFWPSYLFFASIWSLVFFIFFYLQILVTKWRWVGGGDLRVWIILWVLYWFFTIHWIFATYMISLIFAVIIIIVKRKFRWIEIPFLPLLFLAYFILLCYYR